MGISFSAGAKAEICRIFPQKLCCAQAECFGILLYCNSFGAEGVKIITESREFAAMLPKLFRRAFGIGFDSLPDGEASGKLTFRIKSPEKIEKLLAAFGFDSRTLALHVNFPVVEEDCCKASFLRGAFLAGGSVTDPEKGYHFEMTTTHSGVARQTNALVQEIFGFYLKSTQRGGAQVLYLKSSEVISDLLAFLGAPVAAMGIMEAKLEKELNNKVNRRCNCDDANISKVVDAAQEQLTAIRVLRSAGALEHLPPKLRQAAEAREAHPSASLTELAALMESPISKSAMSSRMKKLQALAGEIPK